MNPIAVAEIVIVSLYLMLPAVPGGNPFKDAFAWKFVNYAPIVTIGALIILTIWWETSAKHWFTGPKHNIDEAVVQVFDK
jgi:energy-converting hydrogenase Eha subunit A